MFLIEKVNGSLSIAYLLACGLLILLLYHSYDVKYFALKCIAIYFIPLSKGYCIG